MAAMLFRGLKGVNLSCASPASTAVADHRPPLLRRASLDRLRSKLPVPRQQHDAAGQASSSRYLLDEDLDALLDADFAPSFRAPSAVASSSSTATTSDVGRKLEDLTTREEHVNHLRSLKGSSSFHGGDRGSTWVRFHTVDGGESAALTRLPRADPRDPLGGTKRKPAGSPEMELKFVVGGGDKGDVLVNEIKSSSSVSRDQVVELRVSLHCKGCAAKVRKHLSRMPGVTSFNIDFASKKVTVIGDITPLGVLSSISKVKNAQLWPPSPPPPPPHLPLRGQTRNQLIL